MLLLLLEKSFFVSDIEDCDWLLDISDWFCLGLENFVGCLDFQKKTCSHLDWMLRLYSQIIGKRGQESMLFRD